MLGVLCSRPKPWIFASLSSFLHGSTATYNNHSRLVQTQLQFSDSSNRLFSRSRRHHSSVCKLGARSCVGGAASIWHAIMPASGHGRDWNDIRRSVIIHHELKGEGSWNVAWDSRPARWLHRPDSAWLLFGVCACLAPLGWVDSNPEGSDLSVEKTDDRELNASVSDETNAAPADYRVTGVPADGRCLFRAIAHGDCLRSGKKAPDENLQRELADELRAQVVDELQKRREETEWFIEGDFDTYVKRIQQPYVWGGEPELLMASHVLKTPISVFMRDRSATGLVNIAKYGEEYKQEEENPINVLFHGYGHYDLLETMVKVV